MTRTPSAPRPRPKLTLVEQIEIYIDVLYKLRDVAADEGRRPAITEQLLDNLDRTGEALRRTARG